MRFDWKNLRGRENPPFNCGMRNLPSFLREYVNFPFFTRFCTDFPNLRIFSRFSENFPNCWGGVSYGKYRIIVLMPGKWREKFIILPNVTVKINSVFLNFLKRVWKSNCRVVSGIFRSEWILTEALAGNQSSSSFASSFTPWMMMFPSIDSFLWSSICSSIFSLRSCEVEPLISGHHRGKGLVSAN